jgi:endonuclease-3
MIRYKEIFSALEKTHQLTMLEQLAGNSDFQKLIATLLSARTKDKTVIPIVKELFAKYPGPSELSTISLKELEKRLYKIGFYRVKAKNIVKLSKMLLEKYKGKVPAELEEMIKLPGVGRKTANCMLNYTFDKPAIAVDIHVHRISNRLGWVKTKTPEETEKALEKLLPQSEWKKVNQLFVDHGQRVCLPRGPKCKECSIRKYCIFGH